MSERKVQTKYYNPQMWESTIPKRKTPKNNQTKIRNMVAMTIQCTVCGEYIFSGKKLNSRKEIIEQDDYLGMKNCRFYIRCTRCASELTFKTDYEHSRYVCEYNCKSIHDNNHHSSLSIGSDNSKEDDNHFNNNTMNSLEKKAHSSREYQNDIEQLQDIKEMTSHREEMIKKTIILERNEEFKKVDDFKLNSKEEDELAEFEEYQSQKRKYNLVDTDLIDENTEIGLDNLNNDHHHHAINLNSFLSEMHQEIVLKPTKKRRQKKKRVVQLDIQYD